ncbi:MAG TPA: glucuronate isomerase [Bacteroidota bacterium]|nr:glucuronate isomerase [Bacteroidota bacterium]
MSKEFIHENFLLANSRAERLYHDHAKALPIIDYHCHLSPKEIAENRSFENLTQIWLYGDHYKWRAMRAAGVDERYITGNASDWEKFAKWAETVPKTLRNPLYHWTHLELKRPFGISGKLLDTTTARGIWDECNRKLASKDFSTQGILKQMNVEVVCTTDDPVSSLEYHEQFAKHSTGVRLYPAFRPDGALAIEDPDAFHRYVTSLSRAAGIDITSYAKFLDALRSRYTFFAKHGCRISDHALVTFHSADYTEAGVKAIFKKLLGKKKLNSDEIAAFKSAVLYEIGIMNWEHKWVQQFHVGAMRNTNSRMMRSLGPDTGFDSIGDELVARSMAKFLDRLDKENKLAKTILYNLNPRDNELYATMIGNFQDGSAPGKIQYGAAWWFLDQKNGMERQLDALSNMGLLSQFVGMITDSRSFLSYPRHEYFRRLLCSILGAEMEDGLIPDDLSLVGSMVKDICYYNAKRYFEFT